MFENLSTNHKISIVLFLIAGILLVVSGLITVINKKQLIRGKSRTSRLVTGKYAVWAGLSHLIIGMVLLMNIVLYFIDLEDINNIFCPSAIILVIIALVLRILSRRDPALEEIKTTEKDLIQ